MFGFVVGRPIRFVIFALAVFPQRGGARHRELSLADAEYTVNLVRARSFAEFSLLQHPRHAQQILPFSVLLPATIFVLNENQFNRIRFSRTLPPRSDLSHYTEIELLVMCRLSGTKTILGKTPHGGPYSLQARHENPCSRVDLECLVCTASRTKTGNATLCRKSTHGAAAAAVQVRIVRTSSKVERRICSFGSEAVWWLLFRSISPRDGEFRKF